VDFSTIDLEQAANAILILITGLLTFFGIKQGMKGNAGSGAKSEQAFEVAGAIVDSSAIKELSGEVTGQAIATTEQAMATKGLTQAIENQTRALVDHREELQELRHELRQSRR
jgi:hypothetical protein